MIGMSWFSFFYCCTLLLPNVVSFTVMDNSETDPDIQREVIALLFPNLSVSLLGTSYHFKN